MTPTELKGHPISELIERVADVARSHELADFDLISNESNASAIRTVAGVVAIVKASLANTPPDLISLHGLNQIHSGLQSAYNELTAFQSNRNAGHIQNAKAQIENNVMPFLWAFGNAPAAQPNEGWLRAIEKIASVTADALTSVQSKRTEFLESMAELVRGLNTAKSQLQDNASLIATQKAEASAALATIQKEDAERVARQTEALQGALKKATDGFEELTAQAALKQAQILESLERSKEDAARIVQVVGNIGVTGNYQAIAISESGHANQWRWITIAFFTTGMIFAGATFVEFWGQALTTENAISAAIRLLYAIVLTTPAWYSARESARHRTNADRARQTELELASLGPFIELMPDNAKHEIRQELTKRYFGNTVSPHTAEPPLSIKEIGDVAIDMIKAAKK